jgi:hypothetical protein
LASEKLNNKHPNSKTVLAKTPMVEHRYVSSIKIKVKKKFKNKNFKKTKHHNIRLGGCI